MSQFENVNITKAANVYFDGKVTSRTIQLQDGTTKSLGIMLPGDYEFNTADKELMEILSGELELLLPDQSEWKTIVGGEEFHVPSNSAFKVKIKTITDYCCSYFS
jgi:purine/pyrimidine-nucleoside phosphorylase